MCQKCGGKSGFWVLHEKVNKTYAEIMRKIVGAVWELLAKQYSQLEWKWAELAVLFSR